MPPLFFSAQAAADEIRHAAEEIGSAEAVATLSLQFQREEDPFSGLDCECGVQAGVDEPQGVRGQRQNRSGWR